MVFRLGKTASHGIVLLRPRLRSPEYLTQFIGNVLSQPIAWEGFFIAATEGRLRRAPLPK